MSTCQPYAFGSATAPHDLSQIISRSAAPPPPLAPSAFRIEGRPIAFLACRVGELRVAFPEHGKPR